MAAETLDAILERRGSDRDQLVEVLQDVQEADGYVSEAAMRQVSERLDVPLIEVYRVASFYSAFSLAPRGKHVLTVCMGTACHVRGAPALLDEVAARLEIGEGGTTDDGLFTVERVNCLGACALGPVVVVDGVYHDHMTPAKLRKLIRSLQDAERKELLDA